jgi:Tol biopolymer transport system component
VTGKPVVLPRTGGEINVSAFDVAEDVLVYVTGEPRLGSRQLLSVDRNGSSRVLAKLPERFFTATVSPDGKRIALANGGNDSDVWTYDTERGVASRVTFDEGEDETPVWSPDGSRLAFAASRRGKRVVAVRSADGSGAEQVLWTSDLHSHVTSWSPDGRLIAVAAFKSGGQNDIWLVPADGSGKAVPFIVSPFAKFEAVFSPDGKFLAYTSNETGQREVYVVSYPGPGGKLQISNMGGRQPMWSRNGRELYYRERNHIMVVPVDTGATIRAGTPRPLFDAPEYLSYDVARDGRFIALSEESERAPTNLHVVLNWQAELKRAASSREQLN